MFSEIIERSNILDMVEEETSEDGASHKVLLRILDKKRWGKLLIDILMDTYDEDTYGVSIRKEYYVDDDGEPTFCWVMLLWGNLEDAVEMLEPLLSKRKGPPPPPSSVQVAAPTSQHKLVLSRSVKSDDRGNPKTETLVRLPHRGNTRNKKLPHTKKLGMSGRGAFVEGIEGDGGNPW